MLGERGIKYQKCNILALDIKYKQPIQTNTNESENLNTLSIFILKEGNKPKFF